MSIKNKVFSEKTITIILSIMICTIIVGILYFAAVYITPNENADSNKKCLIIKIGNEDETKANKFYSLMSRPIALIRDVSDTTLFMVYYYESQSQYFNSHVGDTIILKNNKFYKDYWFKINKNEYTK